LPAPQKRKRDRCRIEWEASVKGRIILRLILAGVSMVFLPGRLLADKTDQRYQHAAETFSRGDLQAAQRELKEILRKKPGYEKAKILLGLAHSRLSEESEVKGNRPHAVAELREAVRLEPDEAYWHSRLAQLLNAEGDAEGATKECAQAAQLSPDDSGLAAGCGLRTREEAEKKGAADQEGKAEAGTGVLSVGGDISALVPTYRFEPAYADKARLVGHQGAIALWIVVDSQGEVERAAIVRPLGLGLDQSALHAVRSWKFKPATRDGKPVPVRVMVEVSFRLF
jgi:TonB family protein